MWVNQPLPFHANAMGAATAFQAAARQSHDKAWALHDKMYDNFKTLGKPEIEKYAAEVGLNVGKLKKDWDDPKIKAEVEAGPEGSPARSAPTARRRSSSTAASWWARSPPTRSRRSSTTRSRRSTS